MFGLSFENARIAYRALRSPSPYDSWSMRNRAIFVHVPKTGGTSIAEALGVEARGHRILRSYQFRDPFRFARFFKFGFCRNPYTRFLSAFSYLKRGGGNSWDAKVSVQLSLDSVDSVEFSRRILANSSYRARVCAVVHFWPQVRSLQSASGRIALDALYRFEELDAAYEQLSSRFGGASCLPHSNRSEASDPNAGVHCLPSEVARVVEFLYADDFASLNYDVLSQ